MTIGMLRARGLLSEDGDLIWADAGWAELPREFGSSRCRPDIFKQGGLREIPSLRQVASWNDFAGPDACDAVFEWVAPGSRSAYRIESTALEVGKGPIQYLLTVIGDLTQSTSDQIASRTNALFEAARAFSAAPSEDRDIFREVARHVAGGVGDVCVIRMLDSDSANLEIVAIEGLGSQGVARYDSVFPERNPVDEGVVGYVHKTGRIARYQTSSPPLEISPMAKASIEHMHDLGIHSVLIAPIRSRGDSIGTIGVMRNKTRYPFSAEDEQFVRDLAQLAAISIESNSLQDELRASAEQQSRFARQMQQIAEASVEISSNRDLDSALELVTRRSREIIGAHMSVTSFTVNQDWEQAIVTTDFSEKYARWKNFDGQPTGAGIYSLVCREGRPYRLTQEELVSHSAWRGFSDYGASHPPLRGWLAAPLTSSDGTNLGVLQLSDRYEGEFTETDEAALMQLAQVASTAIDNARLNEDIKESLARVEDHARRLEILSDITKVLVAAPLDPNIIAQQAAIQIGEQIGDTCIIRFLSDDGEFLKPVGVYHPDPDVNNTIWRLVQCHHHRVDEGLAGACVQSGKTDRIALIEPDQARNLCGNHYSPYLEQSEFHSSLVTPLIARNRIMGSLGLSRISPGQDYTAADADLVESIAGAVALAIDNGFLFAAENQARELAQRALDSRDTAMQELERLNEELEDRVRDRTTKLVAINEELEAFAYSVTHDLRAPLRAIDGFSMAVIEDFDESVPETARMYLERVRSASQRMGNIIDDLLRLSRLSQAELHERKIDLSVLAGEIVTDVLGRPAQNGVQVDVHPDMWAVADERLLRLALENLISNAVKFSSKRGDPRVEIGCQPGDAAVYFVRDNGTGFDMEYAEKLFRPFQRLHSEHEFEGTGIGLAIVQRVVHRHGGALWAESTEGDGATFYFSLSPASEENAADAG